LGRNLDAFNDILHGGFATPEGEYHIATTAGVRKRRGEQRVAGGLNINSAQRWPLQRTLTDPVRVASSTADAYVSGSHDDVAPIR
jgi:hypothetical protein